MRLLRKSCSKYYTVLFDLEKDCSISYRIWSRITFERKKVLTSVEIEKNETSQSSFFNILLKSRKTKPNLKLIFENQTICHLSNAWSKRECEKKALVISGIDECVQFLYLIGGKSKLKSTIKLIEEMPRSTCIKFISDILKVVLLEFFFIGHHL